MSDELAILGLDDIVPVLTKKVPIPGWQSLAEQQARSIKRFIEHTQTALQTVQGMQLRLDRMNYNRRHDIDDRVKGWFVSSEARNRAYGVCALLALLSFTAGVLIG